MQKNEVTGIPIYESKIVKVGKERTILLFNNTDKKLNMEDHQEDFKESYECDHLIMIQKDKSCRIYTKENSRAFIPESSETLERVEVVAVDFLESILEKEKENAEMQEEISAIDNMIEKLREIDGCYACGGTGEEIKGYLLDGRRELIGNCSECLGTGVVEDLEECVWVLRDKIEDVRKRYWSA